MIRKIDNNTGDIKHLMLVVIAGTSEHEAWNAPGDVSFSIDVKPHRYRRDHDA